MRKNPAAVTFALLSNYSFELGGSNLADLIHSWLNLYPGKWVITATVEAIYQGRYKVNSVSRILQFWSLKGYPVHHFDYDFADVVCKKLIELDVSETTLSTFQGAITMGNKSASTVDVSPVAALSSANAIVPQTVTPINHPTTSNNSANAKIDQCERLVVHLSA